MQKHFKKYRIQYKGLAAGLHTFTYDIDETFFALFPTSEITQGKVLVNIDMLAKTTGLQLDFNLTGTVMIGCDICIDEFEMPVNYKSVLHVRFSEKSSDISDVDDVLLLAHEEHEIDVSQHIFEFIHLSLPLKRVHPKNENGKSTCNKEMIQQLKKYKIATETGNDTDPRWDDLKKLLN